MPEDAPYDPYIPSGQAAPAQGAGNARTQALQAVSLSPIATCVFAMVFAPDCEALDGVCLVAAVATSPVAGANSLGP